ncbi:hypothetical protein NDU88_007733 [Pleurodeles waltl]|uniref:Uncharacterized protein n=1 Tax=Pleurodeles waltl TaxID=8319 RepID=A0AAV7STC8_PLEWA|nr:hypothetical protein NDU88_007733 [Pleurodeles waltl]
MRPVWSDDPSKPTGSLGPEKISFLLIVSSFNIAVTGGRGLTAGQDGRHYVRLCLARGRLSVLLPYLTVLAGASLARSFRRTPGLLLASRERRSGRSGRGEARAGLLTALSACAVCRAGGRGGPRRLPEVRYCVLGLLGGLIGPRPVTHLVFVAPLRRRHCWALRLIWGLAVWTGEGEARTETSWRGEAFSGSLGGSSLLSLAFGGEPPGIPRRAPGLLVEDTWQCPVDGGVGCGRGGPRRVKERRLSCLSIWAARACEDWLVLWGPAIC